MNDKSVCLLGIGFGGIEEWVPASSTEKVHEMVISLPMIVVVKSDKGRVDDRGLAVFTLMCEFLISPEYSWLTS